MSSGSIVPNRSSDDRSPEDRRRAILLLLVVLFGLAVTIVPRFLDRIYYRGPASDHFDGERFFNPDGDDDTMRPPTGGSRAGFFWRYLTGATGGRPGPTRSR